MYCSNCGRNIGDARFCAYCGTPARDTAEEKQSETKKQSELERVTECVKKTFEDMTGGKNETVIFSLKDLWCDVMKKHSAEESEELLCVGTRKTTPKEAEMAEGWSKPWLYSRVFLVLAVTFAMLMAGVLIFGNINTVPGFLFIGAMLIPFSLLVLFWETNIPRNISIFELVKMFFVGGMASLMFTLLLFEFASPDELNVVGAIVVGVVEEIGKGIAVALFIRRMKCKYILNGILVGAAIGTGFAVFESAGYGLTSLLDGGVEGMIETTFLRAVLAPGGHVVWAAMTGAAIMLAQEEREFSMDIFRSARFWKLFPVPVVLHSLWDMPFSSLLVVIVLMVIAWVFVLALIKSGMREITVCSEKAKKKAQEEQTAPILPALSEFDVGS